MRKNVLMIEKFLSSLEQFIWLVKDQYKHNAFSTCSWKYLRSNILEQLKFKLEKIIGIQKPIGKVRKCITFTKPSLSLCDSAKVREFLFSLGNWMKVLGPKVSNLFNRNVRKPHSKIQMESDCSRHSENERNSDVDD